MQLIATENVRFYLFVYLTSLISDINECEVNANICVDEDEETSSDCINTPGDYVCNNCENLGENVFSYYGERRGCCSLGSYFALIAFIDTVISLISHVVK